MSRAGSGAGVLSRSPGCAIYEQGGLGQSLNFSEPWYPELENGATHSSAGVVVRVTGNSVHGNSL